MQTCGSGCAPRSPRPSRKPTSSCSPPSGDNNAIHINEEFAAGTIFKGRIAHGLLSASVISAAIANPSGADDTVRATVTVKEMIPVRSRVLLATVCTVGVLVVIEGEALVALPAPSPPEYLSPVAFEKEAALA